MSLAIITTPRLAKLLGKSRATIWQWSMTDASLAGCVIRRTKHSTYWSVQRLQERGFLTKPAEHAPVLSFDYRVAL